MWPSQKTLTLQVFIRRCQKKDFVFLDGFNVANPWLTLVFKLWFDVEIIALQDDGVDTTESTTADQYGLDQETLDKLLDRSDIVKVKSFFECQICT